MKPETIRYGTKSADQVMDLYKAEAIGKRPVIILVHGGAFLFGDQKMKLIQPVITNAINRGYTVVSVDYRKAREAHFPGALADVKTCVRYIRAHADDMLIDANRITIWGESAGGYLALMTALTPTVKELDGDMEEYSDYSSSVDHLVVFYPPVEFFTMKNEYLSMGDEADGEGKFESMFLGVKDIYQDKTACDASYWETYKNQLAESFSLAAWIQVGDEHDTKVPYKQSRNFAERLSTLENITVRFEQILGAGHEDPIFYTDENIGRILDWMGKID